MACEGATTGICTGLTNAEPCQAPKIYNASFDNLEDVELSYGPPFTIVWSTSTSYPTHIVRGFIRNKNTVGYTEDELEIVSRDLGTMDLSNTLVAGERYRITLRPESATEYGDSVTVEVTAETLNGYPLGKSLLLVGPDELFIGTDYVYE